VIFLPATCSADPFSARLQWWTTGAKLRPTHQAAKETAPAMVTRQRARSCSCWTGWQSPSSAAWPCWWTSCPCTAGRFCGQTYRWFPAPCPSRQAARWSWATRKQQRMRACQRCHQAEQLNRQVQQRRERERCLSHSTAREKLLSFNWATRLCRRNY